MYYFVLNINFERQNFLTSGNRNFFRRLTLYSRDLDTKSTKYNFTILDVIWEVDNYHTNITFYRLL